MKAHIRQTAWGNWYGYLGSKRVIAFTNDAPGRGMEEQALIFALALAALLVGIAADPVFLLDERSYVGAARTFITGAPSVNPEHPPLVKYLIAGSIKIFGDGPFGWRFASALAGALVALCAFGLTLRLTGSAHSGYVALGLLAVNGFWFPMSRMASLSIFELGFEMAAVWAFLIAVEKSAPEWYLAAGALFGLSIGSRWCGIVGLAVCIAYAVWLRLFRPIALIVSSAVAVYFATWVPLIVREHRGPGYLIAANRYILHFHQHATNQLAAAGEPWWTWITGLDLAGAFSQLNANPVITILGLLAVISLVCQSKHLLPALYVAHVMQWAITSAHWQHYYYYLEAFTWLTLALAVALSGIKLRRTPLDVLVLVCAVCAMAVPIWRLL